MIIEEMARAYAEGYNKEYQQIAYDSFLCGYGAKCGTESPEGLEKAADKYAERLTTEPYLQVVHKTDFKTGAEWMKDKILKLIETRVSEIIGDAQPNPVLRIELQGIIDKIK